MDMHSVAGKSGMKPISRIALNTMKSNASLEPELPSSEYGCRLMKVTLLVMKPGPSSAQIVRVIIRAGTFLLTD